MNRSILAGMLVLPVVAGMQQSPALATAPAPDGSTNLQTVTVIGTTPIPGTSIDIDKVPSNVETLQSSDLTRDGAASLVGALNGELGSVNINDTLADPFQPDILYRGFEASPVLGTPEGIAVYQNGVRINEAFGDAVNWDLIPDIAISRVDFVSANPVYGLNALGGAASITMKNGFNYKGGDLEFSGGSFYQRQGSAEIGGNNGQFGFYAGARILNQEGWRFFSADSVKQIYTALSMRGDFGSLDLSYTRDDNKLFGQGAAPIQSLDLDPRNVFTGPQDNFNRLDFVALNGSFNMSRAAALQGVVYYRNYRQTVANGDHSDYIPCTTDSGAGLLCQGDGVTPLVSTSGQAIPDVTNGGSVPLGQNDFESVHSISLGGSLQFSDNQSIGGYANQLTAGVSFDSSHTDFMSGTEIGVIDPNLLVAPSPYFVDTPEDTGFSATPVILRATNRYYGYFATDTFNATPAFAITASGRYNVAQIDLFDQRGTDLDGNNHFSHFNPAIGGAYKLSPVATLYGGYSITNRTPNASEIECSDPLLPCLLPANLAGDPPGLKQVIAHTYEVGLRGKITETGTQGDLTYNLSLFRTNLDNDLYAISTSISTGFFQNIGSTRRQGLDAGFKYRLKSIEVYADYSYINAEFESALTLNSPSSPSQDANGNIQVLPGDHLPLIPQNRLKAGLDYDIAPQLTIGGTFIVVTDSFYKGDESNQNPELPGYHVLNLHASYHFSEKSELFISAANVFNTRYSTFGLFSDPTGVGAPGVPANANSNDPGVDNRFQSPGQPRSVFGGIRLAF